MKFDKHFPADQLKPYIKYFVVSENELENEYSVFRSSGLVIGFQYKGQPAAVKENTDSRLTSAALLDKALNRLERLDTLYAEADTKRNNRFDVSEKTDI